jgi:hypothetical protein
MATPLMTVYQAFLAKIEEDEWARGHDDDMEWILADWESILESALPYFRYPRCSLEYNQEEGFVDEAFGQDEIQVIATFMKLEWLRRTVLSWKNIKTQYSEKDFSQANLLSQFINLQTQTEEDARHLEHIYYRSRKRKTYDYGRLVGGKSHRYPRHD